MMYVLKFHTAYNEYSKSGDLARVVKKDYKNFSAASAAATRIANINRKNAVRGKCKEFVHWSVCPANECLNVYRFEIEGDSKPYREVTAHDVKRAKAVMSFYKPILGLSGKKIKNVTIAG